MLRYSNNKRDQGTVKLNNCLEDWHLQINCLNDKHTAEHYLQQVNGFIWYNHISAVNDITSKKIQGYILHLSQKNRPNTTHNHYFAIRSFCNYCCDNQYLSYNPALKIKLPRIIVNPPVYLEKEQIKILLIWSKRLGYYYEIKTAISTGMRENELRFLRWENIDFDLGIIRIVSTIQDPTKNRKSRSIPLLKDLADDLIIFREKSGYVFPGKKKDRPRSLRSWTMILGKVREKYNCFTDHQTWHVLRHTFATQLLRQPNGPGIHLVSEWLGHSNIQTTLDYYGNLVPEKYDPRIEVLKNLYESED